MLPKEIGPYHVVDTLGSGGAGTVYRVVDRRSSDVLALKLLTAAGPTLDPRAARRLAREFEALAHLSHPNVVRVFDTGLHEGYPYLTMELIEGLTLRNYLSLPGAALRSGSSGGGSAPRRPLLWELEGESDTEEGPAPFDLAAFGEEAPSEVEGGGTRSGTGGSGSGGLTRERSSGSGSPTRLDEDRTEADLPFKRAAPRGGPRPRARPAPPPDLETLNSPDRLGRLKDAMVQVSEALAYIHAKGLVHRDLKPSNIMVDEDRQVRLMDFGLAKFLADDDMLTAAGRHVGTYRYMSPEQILGEPLDGRADLYSLGVLLYELLCGRPPFDGETPDELWQRVLETEPIPVTHFNPRADPQLARVALKLLRKEPEQRIQTAEEVYEAFVE
jgi:serine/threonine protein kinase